MLKKLILLFCLLTLSWSNELENLIYNSQMTRPAGFGGAYTAVGLGAEAVYYNPGSYSANNALFYYNEADRNGVFYQKNIQRIAKLGRLALGSTQVLFDDGYSDISTFSLKLLDKQGLGFGINYHKVQFNLPNEKNYSGTIFDAGLELRLTPTWKIGVVAKNFSVYRLPVEPAYRFGLAKELGPFLFAYDLQLNNQNKESCFGVEFRFIEEMSLLWGINSLSNSLGLNLNLGSMDYYLVCEKKESEYLYYFSMAIGKKENNFSGKRQSVAFSRPQYLLLDFANLKPGSNLYSIFGGRVTGTDYLVDVIRLAADDQLIGGLIIRLGNLDNSIFSAALAEELRTELQKFKAAGKKVLVYIEGETSGNGYFIASIADKICLPRSGAILMLGKNLTITKYQDFLKKIGIKAEIYKVGTYKASLNSLSDKYSEQERANLISLVENIDAIINEPVKERVPIAKNQAPLLAGKIITASKALELGLIEQIGFYEDLVDHIKDEIRYVPKIIDLKQFMLTEANHSILPLAKNVAIVNIEGAITDGENRTDVLFGNRTVGAESIVQLLAEIEHNPTIKAVILRINSPGGSALATDRIYTALLKLKQKKKYLVASVGNMAASGGFYLACAADKIVANRTSLVGSIGVIGISLKAEELYKNLGITEEVIKTGEYLDVFNTGKVNDRRAIEMIEDYQQEIYQQFKKAVALGRKIDYQDVEAVAQGRIFSGSQALKHKLIDQTGNFTTAIAVVEQKIGKINLLNYVNYEGNWYSLPSRIAVGLGLQRGFLDQIFLKDTPQILMKTEVN